MPFRSQAQRRMMHAKHPDIAERWEAETPKGKKLPERVGKKKRRYATTGEALRAFRDEGPEE